MTTAPHAPRFEAPPVPDAIAGRLPLARAAAPRPPKKPTAQLSRAQILDATLACLKDAGYDGTTIRSIAKRLSCAVGSIYRYFKDKRQLLDAVCQRRFEPVVQQLESGAGLDVTAAAYARAAVDEPEMYQLMFWLGSVGQDAGERTMPAVIEQIIEGWSHRLGNRREAERFWSQLHGGIMLGRHTQPAAAATPAPASDAEDDAAVAAEASDELDSIAEPVGHAKARRRTEPAETEDLTLL